MIIANFSKGDATKEIFGVWQYSYGQTLRIQGLTLPSAVEVHFSLENTGGEATTRIGVTKDGVTDVIIPDRFLENGDATLDYQIYAFIYLRDEISGQTEYKITMHVTSRPKPEAFDRPQDAELFREAIKAVNESAARSAESEKQAEGWAHGREDLPERIQDNAMYYAGKTEKDAEKTATDRIEVERLVESVSGIDEQVEKVEGLTKQAQTSATNAALSEQAAKESENNAARARAGAEIAEDNAELAAQRAEQDKAIVEQAKNLVKQMGQEVLDNKNLVDKTAQDFTLKAQQALADVNNAGQAQTERVQTAGNAAVESVKSTQGAATEAVETAKTEAIKAAQTEGTTQTGNVTAEGEKQVQAVQDAAQEIMADREQIQTNKEDVAKLNSDMNQLSTKVYSTNLFDESSMIKSTNGWYHPAIAVGSAATITTAAGYSAIAIPISGAGKYTFGADAATSGVTRLYNYVVADEQNIVIEKAIIDKWINKGDDHVTITVNSDTAAYLLLSIYGYDKISGRNVRLNDGGAFLPYEPYFPPYLSVSDSIVSDLDNRISARRTIKVLKSDNDVSVLLKMLAAYQHRNTDVYFEKGVYTLSDMYDYIRNDLHNVIAMALPIGNGCRYFMNDSTIISNAPADGYSDARNVLDCQNRGSDYEIYDATLINNGGRYCIHDEGESDVTPYFHKYYNVHMYINDGTAAFGSGVGFDVSMTFDGCSFVTNNSDSGEFPFFIHAATNNPDNKCNRLHLMMKNSYINSGTIGLNLFEKNRDKLDFYLFGNMFKQEFENDAVKLVSANNIVF